MRSPAFASLVLLSSCASTTSAPQGASPAEYRSSRIDVHLGIRSLDEDAWSPVEDQATIGIDYVHEGRDAPIGFEFAFFASRDYRIDVALGPATVDVSGETQELAAGVRKTFLKDARIHPYLGGGVSAIRAQIHGESSGTSASDDDVSAGLYLHGGLDFDLGRSFVLGLDLRFLGATDVRLLGTDGTADYTQGTFFLGWRF